MIFIEFHSFSLSLSVCLSGTVCLSVWHSFVCPGSVLEPPGEWFSRSAWKKLASVTPSPLFGGKAPPGSGDPWPY